MRIGEIENKVGAQLQSIAAVIPENVGRYAAQPRAALQKIAPKQSVLRPALAMSVACVGVAVLGSLLHRGNAWRGLDAMASGLPFFEERRGRRVRFDLARVIGGIGAIVGGSLLVSAIEGIVGNKLAKSKAARGAMAACTALVLDRALMSGALMPSLKDALSRKGVALKYGAVGAAYALTSGQKQKELHDPSGGDIAAGVPAM